MRFTAVSPFGESHLDEVETVVIDTSEGRRVILPEHGDFVGVFDFTELTVIRDGDAERSWAAFGYVHVYNGDVVLIAQMVNADEDVVARFHERIVAVRRSGQSRFAVVNND